MNEFISALITPQSLVSLAIALAGIRAGYKVLEKKVADNEEKIKKLEKKVELLESDLATQIADIKSKITSIDVNMTWVKALLEKKEK